MTLQQAILIGQLMCRATHDILWPAASSWPGSRDGSANLHCRVGRGRATYHRYDPQRQQHLITYGVQMIADKQQADSADIWLSAREIRHRSYFDGELSPLNLLAHTCCHEFAHLLQCNAGERHYRSVHNQAFYRILDALHASGQAQATRRFLAGMARQLQLELPDRPFGRTGTETRARHWQVGQAVSFGEGRQGRILRVNRRTCTVAGTGAYHGRCFRVPFPLLRPLS